MEYIVSYRIVSREKPSYRIDIVSNRKKAYRYWLAKRLATSRYWDPNRRSPSPSAIPPQPAQAALSEKLRKVKSVARKILGSEALVEAFIAKFPPKLWYVCDTPAIVTNIARQMHISYFRKNKPSSNIWLFQIIISSWTASPKKALFWSFLERIFWSTSDKNFNLFRPAVHFSPLKSHIWCKNHNFLSQVEI